MLANAAWHWRHNAEIEIESIPMFMLLRWHQHHIVNQALFAKFHGQPNFAMCHVSDGSNH